MMFQGLRFAPPLVILLAPLWGLGASLLPILTRMTCVSAPGSRICSPAAGTKVCPYVVASIFIDHQRTAKFTPSLRDEEGVYIVQSWALTGH